uniref:Rho/rac guanine nucleotide exchange factor (GEF) 18a n=1 Tax=Amphiprion ocellaris TaxID=80972 RepID=A0A3Q1BUZ9_AMPOC
MDEIEGLRLKRSTEDSLSLASSLVEPINLEDSHYAALRGELESDSQNLEAESWSLAVDQNYLKDLSKEAIKRQDVIYELIQTEMHHVRTLKVLLHVYMHELKQSQLIEVRKLDWLFLRVEALLILHQHFLNCLKMRQNQSQEEGNSNNYYITQLSDILISQFSGTLGEQMMECYSIFCSHHSEAISFYKEQMQNSKKLQILIRKIGQLPIVRRLGISECFLLVTQRITKYPVLVERIIQNTEADTDEHKSLVEGLALIKDTIFQVNAQVSEYEKAARLKEISLRLESKSVGRLKNNQLFRREDLIQDNRTLLHEGTVTWKLPGRQKDIHAVLLSDVLLLLQEKDQKLVFAAVDNKPSVISLQGLIVREVALDEKAMYLICACTSSMPELYQIQTGSKEECITWTTLIREAVECHREEEVYHDLLARLQHVQVETLQNLLFLRIRDPNLPTDESTTQGGPLRDYTIGVADSNLMDTTMKNGDAADQPGGSQDGLLYSSHTGSDHQLQEIYYSDGVEQSADDETDTLPRPNCSHFPEVEVCDSVIMLAQRLYSLQAIIAQQDSLIELQNALQSKTKQPARHYSNVLLEQEKQRNLEKQKEELANLYKLQAQHREEQQRWEKERERQRIQIETLEAQLQQREEECGKWEKKLNEEKAELERQKKNYQQDLERLRESTRSVEKDKERLTQEKDRLEQLQEKLRLYISNPGLSNYDDPAQSWSLFSYPSFRGSIVNGGGTLTPKPKAVPTNFSDSLEIPPKVPPRKESISPQPVKRELPIHLISTTNQVHNPTAVQQQIPTKLAALAKGKEKGFKTKPSHQRTHSAASIDVNQVLPIRVTGKEGGSLRAKRSSSPQRICLTDTFRPPGSAQNVKSSQSFSTNKRSSSDTPPPAPLPFPKDVLEKGKEKVIFF